MTPFPERKITRLVSNNFSKYHIIVITNLLLAKTYLKQTEHKFPVF